MSRFSTTVYSADGEMYGDDFDSAMFSAWSSWQQYGHRCRIPIVTIHEGTPTRVTGAMIAPDIIDDILCRIEDLVGGDVVDLAVLPDDLQSRFETWLSEQVPDTGVYSVGDTREVRYRLTGPNADDFEPAGEDEAGGDGNE